MKDGSRRDSGCGDSIQSKVGVSGSSVLELDIAVRLTMSLRFRFPVLHDNNGWGNSVIL